MPTYCCLLIKMSLIFLQHKDIHLVMKLGFTRQSFIYKENSLVITIASETILDKPSLKNHYTQVNYVYQV